ncbi:MAG: NAD(P)/FAD-dependent oxidoreductase [Propionibacteriales bacterium]|nr:NAD(P)/FAD-dependent oxidoreductase [Propionibacteriales bacterium]
MMSTEVDVVVVGLGPGGESVATELAKAGLEVVGVDKHLVGGECPYYGCIPSKMMIRGADLLAEGRRIPEMAGSSTVAPEWAPVAARIAAEATDNWDDKVAVDRLVANGVTFVRGQGRLAGPRTVQVGRETFVARRGVVLNTGTEPGVPPIPGLSETPYWTNRDAVQLKELPGSLIVIGGGAIGVELAQVFSRFGVEVTVVEVADRLLALEEPESSKAITEVFGAEGIQVIAGAEISTIEYVDGHFSVTVDDQDLRADKLLVAAGRRNNLADIGLETVDLDPTAKTLDTDERMRVAPGLWAIGDITGKGAFTHMSMYQANIATQAILGSDDAPQADYRAVPRVTFTDPEVGSVGMTEQQARDQGLAVRVGQTVLATSARGWIHQAGNAGFIKLIEDADAGVLVGASAVGPNGGEILSALSVAVHAEVPTRRLASMIYAYPTFHRAIEDALKDLTDGSD